MPDNSQEYRLPYYAIHYSWFYWPKIDWSYWLQWLKVFWAPAWNRATAPGAMDGEHNDRIEYRPIQFAFVDNTQVEEHEEYQPGGFHPIHLDDVYDGGRYRVIHKLGSGGFSTVWMAQDLQSKTLVSLRFMKAQVSASYEAGPALTMNDEVLINSDCFVTPMRSFWVDGPNGRHSCQVLPLVGPNLEVLSSPDTCSRFTPTFAAHLARQAALAMWMLHSRGKCHGDFTMSNLALAMSPEKLLYEKNEVYRVLGAPLIEPLVRLDAEAEDKDSTTLCNGPHAPEYLVGYIGDGFLTANEKVVSAQLRVLDFDQAFCCDNPPAKHHEEHETMINYLAPERIAGVPPSKASDVWSLGCAIFQIRSGQIAFDVTRSLFCGGGPTIYAMRTMSKTLGTLPDYLVHARFDRYGWVTKDDGDSEPLDADFCNPGADPGESLPERIARIRDCPPALQLWSNGEVDHTEYDEEDLLLTITTQLEPNYDYSGQPECDPEDKKFYSDSMGCRTRSEIRKLITPYPSVYQAMLWRPATIRVDGHLDLEDSWWDEDTMVVKADAFPLIEDREAELFVDLMSRIFVYEPETRATVQEVLAHPWFDYHERSDWGT